MSKQFNFPQLMQHVWDNNLFNTRFNSVDKETVIEFFEEDDWDVYGEDCKKTTMFNLEDMERI